MRVPQLRGLRSFLLYRIPLIGAVVSVLLVAGDAPWHVATGVVTINSAHSSNAHAAGELVPVSAQVAGRVLKVHASARQYVKAGTVLFELDPTNFRLALARSRARMAAAQTQARSALSALAVQERAVNAEVRSMQGMSPAVRLIQVPAATADPAAAAEVQQAQSQVAAAHAGVLKAAQAQLAVAQAQVATAQQTLAHDKVLVADGLIAARQLEVDAAAYEAAKAQADAAQAAVRRAQASPGPLGGSRHVNLSLPASDPPAPASLAQAQQRVTVAQANVGPAQAGLEAAQQTIDHDQALLAQGAIAAQQLKADTVVYEAAKAQADAAEAAYRQAQAQVAAARAARRHPEVSSRVATVRVQPDPREPGLVRQAQAGVAEAKRRATDLAAAEARVVGAQEALRVAEANLSQTVIRAAADGWITNSTAFPGQVVRPNQPVMWLAVAPGQTAATAGGPSRAVSGPSQEAVVRRERLARIAEQERRILAQLNVESARIQAIIVNSVPGQHAGPVPTHLGDALLSPVPGEITSGYGWRIHPIFSTREFHTGIDIAAPMGTPIRAAADGTVLFTGWMPANGMLLILYHGNGLSTTYSHLSAYTVHTSDHVQRGEIIARVGSTGWSTGPHLFFEVRKDGRPVDPLGP